MSTAAGKRRPPLGCGSHAMAPCCSKTLGPASPKAEDTRSAGGRTEGAGRGRGRAAGRGAKRKAGGKEPSNVIDGCTLAGRGGAGPGCQWTMLKKETARLPSAPDRSKDTAPAKSNKAGVVNLSAHKR